MSSRKSNNDDNEGRSRRNGGNNFCSVPADDGFRNYMARKIELQRKQFGLVVPPPPPPPPPSPPHQKKTPTPKILKRGRLSKTNSEEGGTAVPPRSEKKTVRFHQYVEIGGVSRVLKNLKQKHTKRRSRVSSIYKRRRKFQLPTLDANPDAPADGRPNHAHTDSIPVGEVQNNSTESCTSVLGVLGNLQKRHGTSSPKRKRPFSALSTSKKRTRNYESTKDDNDDTDDNTTPARRRENSPKCMDNSTLNGFESIHDGIGQKDGFNECLQANRSSILNEGNQLKSQIHYEEQDHSSGASSDPYGLFGSPTEKHSPVGESLSPPAEDSQDGHRAESRAETPKPLVQTATTSSPAATSTLTNRPDLFFIGIVVLVNGHTSPDSTTLMRLLHKHGGDLEKYETRRVTHIIANQLSVAKANVYKRQKKPTPVCRPEWITESVERGKLLPFGDYLLEDVKDAAAAKSVKSFFNTEQHLAKNRGLGPNPKVSHNEGPLETEKESLTNESSHHRWQDTHPSKASCHVGPQVRTVGNDPNFLDSYFENSRLSYIGSFKQRAKPNKNSSFSRSKAGGQKFVLLVDMDCFFAAVALRKHPQYKNKPVAVGHAHSSKSSGKNSSSELSTCNYIAREHGIKKGMFLGDAIQLCPELVVLPYDFKGFEEVSGMVADLLHAYAERYIGCIEQVSCDESYVEINLMPDDCPSNDIYGFVNTLAEHIRADILNKTDCTASIGIGPNKLLAKLAADRVKPNACCVVKDWREFLDGLNLRDIPGIGRKFQKKLQPHGLCTVNDVWDLEDDAERVLGNVIGLGTAHKIVQYCHGEDDRVVTPAVQKSIGAECNYGVRFDGPYGVDYMMQGLAKEVQKRMNRAGVRGAKLTVKVMVSKNPSKVPGKFLGHGLCDSISRSGDIPLTRDKDIISSAALKLSGRLGIDKKSVRGMGIVIGSLISDEEVDPLNSSPSKLSAWLKKDSTAPINDVEDVPEDSEISNKVTFTIDDDDASGASVIENPGSGNEMVSTFSQLDQDVLHSLPDDILSEVKSMYGKKSSHPTQSTSKSPVKGTLSDKPIPIAGQTSVRRMLKLACIKSGEARLDQDGVSLSQLDRLPMEVQLQVANGDDIKIVKRPKQTNKDMKESRLHCPIDDEVVLVQSSHTETQEQGILDSSLSNFYQENIAPLQDFIHSNPNPDRDEVDSVKCFLSLCIEEKRIDDAVIFLRTIKNMQGGWDDNIYLQLRESTVREVFSSSGSQLDIQWLGL